MINKAHVSQRFSRAVNTYDQYADVQRAMADELVSWGTDNRSHVSRILEIGCGTGYLTGLLLDAFPEADIMAVDLSAEMVLAARKAHGDRDGVTFCKADAETVDWSQKGPFDLIVSNATVQWFSNPQDTLKRLVQSLSFHGRLTFSTFGPQTFMELYHLFREVETEWGWSTENHGLPLRTETEWKEILGQAFLYDVQSKQKQYRPLYRDSRHFLASIRHMGATHSSSRRSPIAASRLLAEVLNRYDQRFISEKGVPATFSALWFTGTAV
ncbi:malonyl-ACP O-methyltransferase BioC [Melghirimyces algeriensis]|uniref:Malonyl-[acyl-carrier protein] O-methyltransferase n=1 Tax=Melghirimyces algeriensis TaxID=910412 RepID=A0A521BMV8_9BACL|nr:malonyl-ACP O-methyltransferase BioC [Melghirimyces algeriensis]SMO48463.1 malonyl-CoA O-methyltransferase [Melghirimyces algeriensis]